MNVFNSQIKKGEPLTFLKNKKGEPLTFLKNKKGEGFTLIELLIIITAVSIIAALTIPIGIIFYQSQTLDEAADDILTALRRAQSQAIFQKNDSAFGVKFLSGSYVLFQGSSYTTRLQSEDESFELKSGFSTSGIDEIVFSKFTGAPSVTGTLIATFQGDSRTISINSQGKIERE